MVGGVWDNNKNRGSGDMDIAAAITSLAVVAAPPIPRPLFIAFFQIYQEREISFPRVLFPSPNSALILPIVSRSDYHSTMYGSDERFHYGVSGQGHSPCNFALQYHNRSQYPRD